MQQNRHVVYPQVFWTSSSAVPSSDRVPAGLCPGGIVPRQDVCLPAPDRKKQRPCSREGACLGFLPVVALSLLALTGTGLALFQNYQQQQDLDALRKVSPIRVAPVEKASFLNGRPEKKVRRRAHLTGKPNQQSLPLDWESSYGHAFISGVRYENRALVIEEPGLYFVYSKVLFRGQTCQPKPLAHVVFKRNPAYPSDQVLMEDKEMNYCMAKNMWARSNYLGALFHLSREDRVSVNASEAGLVSPEEAKTFFGLYML
uniref:Tumor necrosis factor ligand superfamily member 6 n=1 Tax=Varanus komodoensis TaxID=61221 RepID=A0A8D2LCZ1_VARKO